MLIVNWSRNNGKVVNWRHLISILQIRISKTRNISLFNYSTYIEFIKRKKNKGLVQFKRQENFSHMEKFIKYLSVDIKTMKKAGVYARQIGFRTKFTLVLQCHRLQLSWKSFFKRNI